MYLKDLRDEFIYDCECRHLAKGSLRNYKAATRFLLEYLELKQITELEDVRPRHIRDLMKEKQDAGSTSRYINDLLKVWRTWFNYLVNEGYLEERDNPAKKVKCLRQPRTIIDTFTVAEMKRMVQFYDGKDFLEVRNKTIIMLLFDTGMRYNEMILMEPEDIKQDYILVKHGKGSKERVVPKSPALSKQLVKYCTLRDGYLKEHPTRYKNLFPSKNGKPMTDEAVARIWMFFKYFVKMWIAVYLVSHTFDIAMAVFDIGQSVVNSSSGIIRGNTAIDISSLSMQMQAAMATMAIGELVTLALETLVVSWCLKILSVVITVIMYGRMIEIYLYTSLAPIPFATMSNREWGHVGTNYFRGLFALAFQAFLMMVCVAIYAALIGSIRVSSDIHSALFGTMAYTVILCFSLLKTGSLSKQIFGSH